MPYLHYSGFQSLMTTIKNKSPQTSVSNVTLPTHVISIFADVVNEQGIRDSAILEGTGLSSCDLRNQNTFISYEQVLHIIGNTLKLYPFPGIGLTVGQREKASSWGLLGFAMMSAGTLRDALEICHQYYQTGPALYDMGIYFEPDFCFINVYTPKPIGDLLPTVVEELFACICTVFPVLIGKPFRAKKLEVTYDKPAYSQQYEKLFRCPISYNCTSNRFIFDNDYLDCPIVTADSISAELSRTLCLESLKRQEQGRMSDLKYCINRILVRTPGRPPRMESVAEEFGMSSRSLRRHLSAQNTTFQSLVDEIRMNMAIDYIHNPSIGLHEVAERVGFTEYNNFRKAFKRWTGHSPSHYRK